MNTTEYRYFFLSGCLTFLLIALIAGLLVSKLEYLSSTQPYAVNQSDVIAVSLETVISTVPPVQEIVNEPVTYSQSHNETPIDSPSTSEILEQPKNVKEKIPALDDLFSSAVTEKPKIKSSDHSEKQMSVLNDLEQKINDTKRESHFSEKVKNLNIAKPSVKILSASSGPQINEYNAQVQAIIYQHFHPPSGTQGSTAKVRLRLSSDGQLILFTVLKYANNPIFNAQVDWLKERLSQSSFPGHPKAENTTFEILLTAKE